MATIQPLGPMAVLREWALSTGAFRRNRMDPEKKVLAAALCNAGYSYREVARLVGGLSYIAARDSYLALLTSLPEESRKYRREVAIDGAETATDGHSFHVWLARDVDAGEILSFYASPSGSAEDASKFLASVGRQCENRPIVRLGVGRNSPRGLVNLDLYFQTTSGESLIGKLGRMFLRTAST